MRDGGFTVENAMEQIRKLERHNKNKYCLVIFEENLCRKCLLIEGRLAPDNERKTAFSIETKVLAEELRDFDSDVMRLDALDVNISKFF